MEICKYPLAINGTQSIEAKTVGIVDIQLQGGVPVLWATVDPSEDVKHIMVHMAKTGQEIESMYGWGRHINTLQLDDGSEIHCFARIVPKRQI